MRKRDTKLVNLSLEFIDCSNPKILNPNSKSKQSKQSIQPTQPMQSLPSKAPLPTSPQQGGGGCLPPSHLILFDGFCHLCSKTVQFILKHDKKGIFYFAPLQSETTKEICADSTDVDSVVYVEYGQIFIRSEAILKICIKLGFPWNILAVGKILPIRWRDKIYDMIAKKRYKWFGKRDSCMMPEEKYKKRFLN